MDKTYSHCGLLNVPDTSHSHYGLTALLDRSQSHYGLASWIRVIPTTACSGLLGTHYGSRIRATRTTRIRVILRPDVLDKSHSPYGLAAWIRVSRTTSYTGLFDRSHTAAWSPEYDSLPVQLTLASWLRITRTTAYWIRVSRTTVLDTSHSHYGLGWPPE